MNGGAAPGLIIAAPASGCGKTVVTLGLLRHLAAAGVAAASVKVGPDYIDPAFHTAASGRPCRNIDPWAMGRRTLTHILNMAADGAQLIVCEGVMGLFDGATLDEGSTAHVAEATGWPVVLVIDAAAQGASAAAVLKGFATHMRGVDVAGVIFNRVGSPRHGDILREAAAAWVPEVTVLGCLPRAGGLVLPERHLGLVQAGEHPALEAFLDRAASLMAEHLDVDALRRLATPCKGPGREIGEGVQGSDGVGGVGGAMPLPVLGQRTAVARDEAFAFCYPLVIDGWRAAGADIRFFSPLDDEAPAATADAVYLPGGYPELHGGRLAANRNFLDGLAASAEKGAAILGECGGYMVLGRGLVDAAGQRHAMAGLLSLETSFAQRRLHLGYRRAVLERDGPLGGKGEAYRGHEFHYAAIAGEGPGTPLFRCADARGADLGPAGLAEGRVMGSFIHLIDREGG